MKELSIEEKAKAYDEAIEKFDVILNLNTVKKSGTIFADDVRKILPELKESEDEKMRRWIINYLDNKALNSGIIQEKTNIKNAIAWLERQGEQKPAEWSEEDETGLTNTIIMLKEGASLHFNKKDITKAVDFLRTLKERYTWKPSEEQMELLREAQQALLGKDCHNRFVNFMYELKRLREE